MMRNRKIAIILSILMLSMMITSSIVFAKEETVVTPSIGIYKGYTYKIDNYTFADRNKDLVLDARLETNIKFDSSRVYFDYTFRGSNRTVIQKIHTMNGLCISRNVLEKLNPGRYILEIESQGFKYGYNSREYYIAPAKTQITINLRI